MIIDLALSSSSGCIAFGTETVGAEGLSELATFLKRAAGLGHALGPILMQFPRSLAYDGGGMLRKLAAVVASSPIPSARIALEVRGVELGELLGAADRVVEHADPRLRGLDKVGALAQLLLELRPERLVVLVLEGLRDASHPLATMFFRSASSSRKVNEFHSLECTNR